MYQLIHDLLEQGVKPQNILFFTFDHPLIRMAGMDQVLNIYKNNISDDAHFYMFVDEVQFDKDWTNYLKMAYDMNPDMRSVATGSASAAGRWTVIKVTTLSFYEYCALKGISKAQSVDDVFRIHTLSKQQQTQLMMGLSTCKSI